MNEVPATAPATAGTHDATPSALPYAVPSTAVPAHAVGSASGLSRFDVAVLALRLIGIYALIQVAPLVSILLSLVISLFLSRNAFGWTVADAAAYVAPSVVYLAIGVLLIAYAHRLAHRLLPDPVGDSEPDRRSLVRTTGRQLQAIAFSVVGLLLIVWSAPSLIQAALTYVNDSPAEGGGSASSVRQNLILFAIQFVAGVWLFLGSKGLSAYWHRLRRRDPVAGPAGSAEGNADGGAAGGEAP